MEAGTEEESVIKETEILASPPVSFGTLLQSRREEAGLSILELARKTGLTRNTIHNIEQGLTTPSPQTLKLVASVKALRLTELHRNREESNDAWGCTAQYHRLPFQASDRQVGGAHRQTEQRCGYRCGWAWLR